MRQIAWQSVRKGGGFSRASNNHYTFDDKVTLCGKKIPQAQKVIHPTDTCAKCLERKEIVEDSLKGAATKVESFKELVESSGGIYEIENDIHKGTWPDPANLYYVYGRVVARSVSGDWINLTQNALYFKPGA